MEHDSKLQKENKFNYEKFQCTFRKFYERQMYVARPQSKFPTRLTASKPYIARSDWAMW
jgi:hypothetical protein